MKWYMKTSMRKIRKIKEKSRFKENAQIDRFYMNILVFCLLSDIINPRGVDSCGVDPFIGLA